MNNNTNTDLMKLIFSQDKEAIEYYLYDTSHDKFKDDIMNLLVIICNHNV